MALEDLEGPDKFIDALVPANPTGTDPKRDGDNHIRGVKNVLGNTFPGLDGAVDFTAAEMTAAIAEALANGTQVGDFRWTTRPAGNDPANWIEPDGRAIDRTTYAEAFALWGTSYGEGDGSTTFNVPDVPEGTALEVAGATYTLGTSRGANQHTLTADESGLPAHNVPLPLQGNQNQSEFSTGAPYYLAGTGQTAAVPEQDAAEAHDIVGPRFAARLLVRIA